MTTRRRAELVTALSGVAAIQTDFDTPRLESVLDTAWPMTSDSYPNVVQEIDRILSCDQQDLTAKEVMRRITRFDMDYDADPILMAIHAAYLLGVAAAPTGSPANEVQTLTKVGSGGTFRIGLPVPNSSIVKYTPQLPFGVTAAALKTALENINLIGRGNVQVTFLDPDWTITFQNNLANADMPLLTLDTALLTGGVHTIVQTTQGVQRKHTLTRISGFQPPAYDLAVGFRNSDKNMRFHKSGVADTMRITGSAAQPRVQVNWGMIASGEVTLVSDAYVPPTCEIFRPARFRDTLIVLDGTDYSGLLKDFELTISNGLITDDDAYTAQDEDIHRAERADQRSFILNLGILGEHGDTIHDMAEALAEVAGTFRVGRSGRNLTFNIPKGSVSLRDPVVGYDGTAKRSKINIQVEPELIPGDATTPYTVDAYVPISETLLQSS